VYINQKIRLGPTHIRPVEEFLVHNFFEQAKEWNELWFLFQRYNLKAIHNVFLIIFVLLGAVHHDFPNSAIQCWKSKS